MWGTSVYDTSYFLIILNDLLVVEDIRHISLD